MQKYWHTRLLRGRIPAAAFFTGIPNSAPCGGSMFSDGLHKVDKG